MTNTQAIELWTGGWVAGSFATLALLFIGMAAFYVITQIKKF